MATPQASDLARRDPARAAMFGALPMNRGATFGADFGGFDLGADFGDEDDDNDMDMDDDSDAEYGADFGVAKHLRHHRGHPGHGHKAHGPKLSARQIAKLLFFWKKMHSRRHRQNRRLELLDPNMGLSTKIERYTFAVNQAEPLTLLTMSPVILAGQPATSIRPQRLVVNSPCPAFVYYTDIKVANLAISIGAQGDSWEFNANAQNSMLDAPTLTPALTFAFIGNYVGLAPAPYSAPDDYTLTAALQGPSTIAG
jgi:hypothetical protein